MSQRVIVSHKGREIVKVDYLPRDAQGKIPKGSKPKTIFLGSIDDNVDTSRGGPGREGVHPFQFPMDKTEWDVAVKASKALKGMVESGKVQVYGAA